MMTLGNEGYASAVEGQKDRIVAEQAILIIQLYSFKETGLL